GRETDAARRAGDQHTFAIQAGIHIDLLRSIAAGRVLYCWSSFFTESIIIATARLPKPKPKPHGWSVVPGIAALTFDLAALAPYSKD
ncbi:MAG: hypothetical protein O7D91_09710, partial [Planctomycetota bacterium]|nr:hypothetical protein [Planctomycetota bacterium]